MWQLWLGVILFAAPHLFSALLPGMRAKAKNDWGRGPYMGLYSLVSLLGLIFLAWGYQLGRAGPASLSMVYEPWYGGRHVMMMLVLLGFIGIFANQTKGYIRKYLGHPFSIGVVLWSLGHLLVNGETAVVVIFGMFLVIALLDIILSIARGNWPSHEPNIWHDVRALVVGVVLFLVFAYGFHPYVLNISVMG